jgi:signal transduction histidine kinase
MSVNELILACNFDTARFLIFSDNVYGALIYYSHFFAIIAALIIGFFVFANDSRALSSKLLLFITVTFSLWVFSDLVLWATEKLYLSMFFWSLLILFEPMVYAALVYFLYRFVNQKDVKFSTKLLLVLPIVPIIFLLPTKLTLLGFDLTNCDRAVVEGFISTYYIYSVETLYILWILIFSVFKYVKSSKEIRRQIMLITAGIILFLISFAFGNIIQSFSESWVLGQLGLFGMPIFVAFLSYMIVRFRTFNIKLLGAQVLVFALGFLVLAILFIRRIENVRIVVIFTLLFVIALGYALIKSVKKEVKQKEELAKLNTDLQTLIQQRESLVHLITHKVKGSFTRTKYIFSEILQGSFGVVSPEMKKMAETGLESDDMGIRTVDLILNASNLQKGTVKYDMKPVDFKNLVLATIENRKDLAAGKGLRLKSEIKDGAYLMNGDFFWLKEVVENLVDNSLKYTQEGEILVGLERKDRKILFSVKDTGVGIDPEDRKNLFTEGGRGRDSVKMNVDSTGYGLYSVKLIVEAHKGKVWAESPGIGQGSIFSVEFVAL